MCPHCSINKILQSFDARTQWIRAHSLKLEGIRNTFCVFQREEFLGRETWSSGYGRRLMFRRSWVCIPALYTYWKDIFHMHLFFCKNL